MKIVFQEKELQERFEKSIEMVEEFRKAVAFKVDMTNPMSVLESLQMIVNVQSTGATAKSMLSYLTEKHTAKKVSALKDETLNANEKRAILNAEIGDVSFYDNLCEALLKEAHYRLDTLRSALSYLKAEVNNLN